MADDTTVDTSSEHHLALTPKESTLAVLALSDDEDGLFRPSLADQLKVGFFNLDRSTQTEASDIVDLKEMTEVLQELLTEVNFLKGDINFAKKTIEADFEDRLTRKALELYIRINEKVENLQTMHKEKVDKLRRAFRQQLADAIARLAALWDKNLELKLKNNSSKTSAEAGKLGEKVKEMQATIQRNESIIHMLKMQLAQYQNVPEKRETTPPPPPPPRDDAELNDLKRKIGKLEDLVENLELANDAKTEDIKKLNSEVANLQNQLGKEKIYAEELEHELSQVKSAWDQDKKSFTRMLDEQKKQFQKSTEQQMAQVREECMAKARMEANRMSSQAEEELRRLREEKEQAELMLSKEKAKQLAQEPKKVVETDTERLIANEKLWRSLVDKYKKEISRIQKAWEKKFAILQASLHALKDEAFLRHTLQRQAATLHQASVSYGVGVPTSQPSKTKQREMTRITAPASPAPSPFKDYNHYTLLPDVDERLQEQMNEDTNPIPQPPSTSRSYSADNKERERVEDKSRSSSAKTINIVLKTQ